MQQGQGPMSAPAFVRQLVRKTVAAGGHLTHAKITKAMRAAMLNGKIRGITGMPGRPRRNR
jgi:hypothetical protein